MALKRVAEPRFFRTERGFHGKFYCALQGMLEERDLLGDGRILEMEYQKSARHGIHQRPDIVLHVPAEESGFDVHQGNLAVWALKRQSSLDEARDDFCKLDAMFQTLRYPLGIFINIDAIDNFATSYPGNFPKRVHMVSVRLENGIVLTAWGSPPQR